MIKIYTDGSYKPIINQGGYAVIITKDNKIVKILYYGYKNTTSNRMELFGILNALKFFTEPTEIEIYSDSNYVVSSINNHYLDKWILENDSTKKNLDLWFQIYELLTFHKVTCYWVKGHDTNEFNNLADLYANIASIVINPEKDL